MMRLSPSVVGEEAMANWPWLSGDEAEVLAFRPPKSSMSPQSESRKPVPAKGFDLGERQKKN
jgi:hypothetical protein